METLEEISFGLALRALGQQERALSELRARTGSLLTASSLIASFLGAQAIARSGLSVFVVAGLVALGLSLTSTIYVLAPRGGLDFVVDARAVYRRMAELGLDPPSVRLDLAIWFERYRARNENTILRLARVFRIASVAVVLEIVFFALALAIP